MPSTIFHIRRKALSIGIEKGLRCHALYKSLKKTNTQVRIVRHQPDKPQKPEDFLPLENACFQYPYDFYQMIRNHHPVYQLPNGIYCISRFKDIVDISRDPENYSSTHQGIIAGLRPGQNIETIGARMESIGAMGVVPSDVLALSDPPGHSAERKVGHKGLNARFVKSLEETVTALCRDMMDEFIDKGEVEFMQAFGWRLPMRLIIQLLGFPDKDYEKIKFWCMQGIASQSGIASPAVLLQCHAESIVFMRYCWKQFLIAKAQPRDDLSRVFVDAAASTDNPMNEQSAVSAIFQLLIAGSDSSATSMGNALKMLIDHPDLCEEIRDDMDAKLPAFIEEVFRLESAFQGHFRWTRHDCQLHGVQLPKGSRVFLMWASGNRDERVFDNPNAIDLTRHNGKKHLTFGHGIHACIGRELARSEIRVVLREFLLRTRNLRLNGETPFQASMFARTLISLPVAFEKVTRKNT